MPPDPDPLSHFRDSHFRMMNPPFDFSGGLTISAPSASQILFQDINEISDFKALNSCF